MRNTKEIEVGLVISEASVQAVGMEQVQGRLTVAGYGEEPLPPGAVEGVAIVNPQAVAHVIRKLRHDLNLPGRSATVALRSPGYAMRALRLPDIPATEQRTLVRGELEETGAMPFRGGAFDFLWVSLPPEGNKRQADAYAYYTGDAEVESVQETLRLSGLQLKALEPLSLATMRAYLAAMPRRQAIALLYPSEKHSDLCIHDGLQVRHLRRIPAGWMDFAQQDIYNVARDRESGGRPSREGGTNLPFIGDEAGPRLGIASAPTQGSAEASPEVLQHTSSLEFLASEVMRSLAFYAREYKEWSRPQELAILGPAPIVEHLRSLFAGSLGIPLAEDNALAAFDLPQPDQIGGNAGASYGYLAALGAAIGDIEPAIPRVDISQQEIVARTRKRAPVVLLTGMAVSTIWMIVSAIAAISLTILQASSGTESAKLSQEIAAIKAQQAPLLRYQEISTAATSQATNSQVPAGAILGRLAASTTPGIQVTRLEVASDGKVSVEGKAFYTNSIQQFASRLGLGKSVQSPVFEMMKQDPDQSLEFRIAGRFRAPAPPANGPAKQDSN